jgi:DNA-binding transcriptional LysR family regulator
MDTHRLKYFLRIAEEGSITRAARSLGIAQPALSRQIRLLEEDLGITLFQRTRRGVELTAEGERLRASTASPLRMLELAVQYAASPLARLERGIRLGLIDTAVDVAAGPLIASLSAAFPAVTFAIATGSTETLIEAMLKGAVDLALINPIADDRLFYRDLITEDLYVIGPATSDFDRDKTIPFTDIAALPLIVPRSSAGIGVALENAALRTKVAIDHRITTDSLAVTKRLVEAGLGYAVLPLSACMSEINRQQLRCAPTGEPALTQALGLAATAQLELPRELSQKLGDILRSEVTHLVTAGTWPARLVSPQPWDPSRP